LDEWHYKQGLFIIPGPMTNL